jgi:hypothetical protein
LSAAQQSHRDVCDAVLELGSKKKLLGTVTIREYTGLMQMNDIKFP